MDCRMDVVTRHENDNNLIVHLHQSAWVTRCIVKDSNIWKGIIFLIVGLNRGLKIFTKSCCEQLCVIQLCCPVYIAKAK